MASMTIALSIFIYLVNIAVAILLHEDECSCSCCIGFYCTPVQKPHFSIPSCVENDAICVTYCKKFYPIDCNHIYSSTFGICISSALKIFNQSMTLTLICIIFLIITRYH